MAWYAAWAAGVFFEVVVTEPAFRSCGKGKGLEPRFAEEEEIIRGSRSAGPVFLSVRGIGR